MERYESGFFLVNSYIVFCDETKEGLVIDPVNPNRLIRRMHQGKLLIRYIVNTHTHPDHVGGNARVKKSTGAEIIAHRNALVEKKRLIMKVGSGLGLFFSVVSPDHFVEDGEEINIGLLSFKILHTPGHTTDGICMYGGGSVFTGDTLFADSVGRMDFPGGSLNLLLKSIHNKLLVLPDETIVYPGHGAETTIGRERSVNPFCTEALKQQVVKRR
ncbi:MAG: MBL fold metallo-hydrolase [bacterium]